MIWSLDKLFSCSGVSVRTCIPVMFVIENSGRKVAVDLLVATVSTVSLSSFSLLVSTLISKVLLTLLIATRSLVVKAVSSVDRSALGCSIGFTDFSAANCIRLLLVIIGGLVKVANRKLVESVIPLEVLVITANTALLIVNVPSTKLLKS